jgi:hypothetical protein
VPRAARPETAFPTGTVTFLFTDIEGSSQLWERHPEAMRDALEQHDLLLRQALQTQGDLRAARTLLAESLGLYRGTGKLLGIAECLESLARLAAAERRFTRAAQCLGAAEVLRETMGAPLPPPERAEYDRTLSAMRSGCSEEAFAGAWSEGRAMSLEQAVSVALEVEAGG